MSEAAVEKITCQICQAKVHAIESHLKSDHADTYTLAQYREEFPDAPLFSAAAEERIKQKRMLAVSKPPAVSADGRTKQAMHELFELGVTPAAMNTKGGPIGIDVLDSHEFQQYVPEKEKSYVYNIEVLKNALLAIQMNIPLYVWGHMGTGKTTLIEQIFHHLNRALIRVQHTVNMEETHVLGEWRVRNGETVFDPGWLPLAMRNGWGYLADEYDFGTPHVLSVYQPVMEGKSLIIKDASPEWRIVKPHPDFRFIGTGNTNGVGDETGLYQGTQIQNAANYERYGVVMKVEYSPKETEQRVLMSRCNLAARDAENMIKFATFIREERSISMPISPRSLINASKLGIYKSNFRAGLELAYINRLPAIERETATQVAQRVFS